MKKNQFIIALVVMSISCFLGSVAGQILLSNMPLAINKETKFDHITTKILSIVDENGDRVAVLSSRKPGFPYFLMYNDIGDIHMAVYENGNPFLTLNGQKNELNLFSRGLFVNDKKFPIAHISDEDGKGIIKLYNNNGPSLEIKP